MLGSEIHGRKQKIREYKIKREKIQIRFSCFTMCLKVCSFFFDKKACSLVRGHEICIVYLPAQVMFTA